MSTSLLKIKRKNERKLGESNSEKQFSLQIVNSSNDPGSNRGGKTTIGGIAPCGIGDSPEITKFNLKGAMKEKKGKKK